MTGNLKLTPGKEGDTETGYRSKFSHSREQAGPGYYMVFLDDYGIKAELTTTTRCGFHQYTLPDHSPVHVIIDLFESITSDIILATSEAPEPSSLRRSSGSRSRT